MVSGFRERTLGNPEVFPFGLSARNLSAKFIAYVLSMVMLGRNFFHRSNHRVMFPP